MSEPRAHESKRQTRPWWFAPTALTRPFLEAVQRAGGDLQDADTALKVEVQVLYASLAVASDR